MNWKYSITECIIVILQIHAEIPGTEVKFTHPMEEENDSSSQTIRGVFSISQRPSILLQGGQALITFEEENGTDKALL